MPTWCIPAGRSRQGRHTGCMHTHQKKPRTNKLLHHPWVSYLRHSGHLPEQKDKCAGSSQFFAGYLFHLSLSVHLISLHKYSVCLTMRFCALLMWPFYNFSKVSASRESNVKNNSLSLSKYPFFCDRTGVRRVKHINFL